MAETTARLALPYIAAAQAQKHVTHNDAIRRLDALVQPRLESLTLATPPSAPVEGQCWLVPPGATGAWAGQAGRIAAYEAGAWDFFALPAGLLAYVADVRRVLLFDGTRWVSPLAASAHGAAIEARVLQEDVALSGSTVSTTMAIPDRAILLGVSTRTVSTVAGATSYDCGTASERTKFGGALGIAAGSSNMGVIGPTAFYAATPVRLSANGGAFTGGTVRVALHILFCPPAEA